VNKHITFFRVHYITVKILLAFDLAKFAVDKYSLMVEVVWCLSVLFWTITSKM